MEESLKDHSNDGIVKHHNWVYLQKIPEEVCDLIVKEFKDKEYVQGTVGNESRLDLKSRSVRAVPIPEGHWCLGFPLYYGLNANIENFKYNVTNLGSTEFFTYEEGMFYTPHTDVSDHIDNYTHGRKLTVIIQLSNSDDYDGGNLILYRKLKPQLFPREKGTVIVFNSSMTHAISKVTRGTRHSLCGWMMGPPFA